MKKFERKMREYLDGEISDISFAQWYENEFNFGSADDVEPWRYRINQSLFDKIVYFSPFPEDKERYPAYITAQEMREIVRDSYENLMGRGK